MKVIEGLAALADLDLTQENSDLERHSAVCVGVFDGVHLGHQRLLHELLEMSSTVRGAPTVITFQNHPDAVLRGEAPPPIVSVPHRLRLLRRAGVHRTVLLTFDDALRNTPARQFAQQVLHDALRTRGLLLGYDSAFGKDREGTPARFEELGAELGFEVRVARTFQVDGETVSSSLIRKAVARGELDHAHRLLGRWPSVFGEVVHGEERGRSLGFPTANVVPQSPVLPPNGVYAAEAIVDGDTVPAIANLGVRPTFAGGEHSAVLEVHLLDWHGNLYGQCLEVAFRARLRDERKFDGPDELKAQIIADVERARAILAS